jgi:hypothetical protein
MAGGQTGSIEMPAVAELSLYKSTVLFAAFHQLGILYFYINAYLL